MSLTHHAAVRLQQRAIPPYVIEFLERFGTGARCGGADRLFFDKAARKRELCGNVGDGANQAADFISATSSIPSLNVTPSMTFGNWF